LNLVNYRNIKIWKSLTDSNHKIPKEKDFAKYMSPLPFHPHSLHRMYETNFKIKSLASHCRSSSSKIVNLINALIYADIEQASKSMIKIHQVYKDVRSHDAFILAIAVSTSWIHVLVYRRSFFPAFSLSSTKTSTHLILEERLSSNYNFNCR
jgi:hypothetical protein